MIVGVIRRKPVLTHAGIVCGGMLASVNSVNSVNFTYFADFIVDCDVICKHKQWRPWCE